MIKEINLKGTKMKVDVSDAMKEVTELLIVKKILEKREKIKKGNFYELRYRSRSRDYSSSRSKSIDKPRSRSD